MQTDVFAREVDEAVRQDDLRGAVRRYGIPAAVALAALLLALAGYLLWANHRQAAQAARSEQLTLALDQLDAGHADAAAAQAAALADGGDGVAAAARLLQADVALSGGHRDQAIKLYAGLAADASAPQPYRDLATIRNVAADPALPPDVVVARLRPLALPGGPWFGSAGELLGMAYLRQGHRDLAAPLFGAIARDPDLPDTLRARTRQMAGVLGFDAVDDIARAPAAGPVSPARAAQ